MVAAAVLKFNKRGILGQSDNHVPNICLLATKFDAVGSLVTEI